jgi:monofunctional biosynthetic peptidoglycan transglycosylase
VTETKGNKVVNPIRQRKQLIARRWCFFVLMVFAMLLYLFWSNVHCGSFGRILSWVVFGVWLFTIVQVLYCKFFPPIVTPLMVRRYFQQCTTKGANSRSQWKYVPIKEISPYLINAVDVAENAGLYVYCRGFLFFALSRAYLHNQKNDTLWGGSTISQQTAKNCFLPHSRTLFRKIIEAYYVVLIELFWGKKHIMECYLNIIEYGRGIYGCEAASQYYFHHSAASLNANEAVLLAATLPSPLSANPDRHTTDYDDRVAMLKSRLQIRKPIDWNARYEDMDIQKIAEGNRGLFFFIKWWCLHQTNGVKFQNK